MNKSSTTPSMAADPAQALDDYIKRVGSHLEGALYRLVCDRNHPSRAQIDKALIGGSETSMVVLGPLLISEYKFQFMTALQVASFAGQQVAARGLSGLCADLTARRNRNAKTLAPIHTPPPTVDLTLKDLEKLKTKTYAPAVRPISPGSDEHAIELTAEDISPVITKSSRLVKRVPKPKPVEAAIEPEPTPPPPSVPEPEPAPAPEVAKAKRKPAAKAKAKVKATTKAKAKTKTKTKVAVKKTAAKKKSK